MNVACGCDPESGKCSCTGHGSPVARGVSPEAVELTVLEAVEALKSKGYSGASLRAKLVEAVERAFGVKVDLGPTPHETARASVKRGLARRAELRERLAR